MSRPGPAAPVFQTSRSGKDQATQRPACCRCVRPSRLSAVSGALVRSYNYDLAGGNSLNTGATTHIYYTTAA
jgi:hypothetical protein